MRSQVNRFHRIRQREPVRNQPGKINFSAKHQTYVFILQIHRRTVRTHQHLFVHANRRRIDRYFAALRLRKKHDPAARTRRIHGRLD